ncbi:hypothetical protein FJT64_024356 [Amphibalanus amphitrite]|uniref:Uncharacterized protein n=1 Tax=Amphibalanus amphitrite TaxID=1232801 RepID=A0A6A4WIS9_AMPAM|nr:hypothetical protein FJT64_024356 [Amphibalanus amphitrite]
MAHLFQQGRPEPVGARTRQMSPLKTSRDGVERDVAVVRTESHAARFNSARALFESMAERRPAAGAGVERRQSAKGAQERSRSSALGGAASRSASAASRLDRVSRSPSPPPGEPRKLNGVGARKASVDSLLDSEPVAEAPVPARRLADPLRRAEVLASARCPDAARHDGPGPRGRQTRGLSRRRESVLSRVSEKSPEPTAADAKSASVPRVESTPVDVHPAHVKPDVKPEDSKPVHSERVTPDRTMDDGRGPAPAPERPLSASGLDEVPTRGPSCTDDASTSPARRHQHSRELVNRQRNWMAHFTGRRTDRSSVSPEGDGLDGGTRTPPAAATTGPARTAVRPAEKPYVDRSHKPTPQKLVQRPVVSLPKPQLSPVRGSSPPAGPAFVTSPPVVAPSAEASPSLASPALPSRTPAPPPARPEPAAPAAPVPAVRTEAPAPRPVAGPEPVPAAEERVQAPAAAERVPAPAAVHSVEESDRPAVSPRVVRGSSPSVRQAVGEAMLRLDMGPPAPPPTPALPIASLDSLESLDRVPSRDVEPPAARPTALPVASAPPASATSPLVSPSSDRVRIIQEEIIVVETRSGPSSPLASPRPPASPSGPQQRSGSLTGSPPASPKKTPRSPSPVAAPAVEEADGSPRLDDALVGSPGGEESSVRSPQSPELPDQLQEMPYDDTVFGAQMDQIQFGSSPVLLEEAWEGSYSEEPESMTPEEADQLLSTR